MSDSPRSLSPRNIQTVGVVGLGLLGRGIATCLLSHEFRTVVFDADATAHYRLIPHADEAIGQLIDRAGFPHQLRENWHSQLTPASSVDELASCDFVIESIVEDFDTKQKLFDQLEAVLPAEIPIASNTSALPITQLQQRRQEPQRFVGMHWAEPCHLTRFLEVIRGEQTGDDVVDQTIQLGKAIGKEPTLVRKDVPGFIVNRLAYAMYREAFWLVENGVAAEADIDRAFAAAFSVWGDIAGPFRWMDLTGVASYAKVMEHLFPHLCNTTVVPERMKELIDAGAQGISNGRGFYQYTSEEAAEWEERLMENVWKNRVPIGQREA